MDSLQDEEKGTYVVTTESSTRYWLDLYRRTLRRAPSFELDALRRDGKDLDLVELLDCRVGHPLKVLINLNLPGVWLTTRESTPILLIEPGPKSALRP